MKYSIIKSRIEKSEKICFDFSSRRDGHLYRAIRCDKTGTKTRRMKEKIKSNFWKSIRDPFDSLVRKYYAKSYKIMKRNYAILRLFVFISPYGDILEENEAVESLQFSNISPLQNSKFYSMVEHRITTRKSFIRLYTFTRQIETLHGHDSGN